MEPRAMKSSEKEEKFERGLQHFNAREFFEAHEVWEEIWLAEAEPEKTFLQGIIQIAAAFHHYRRGNSDGAETLLAAGIVKIMRFPADHRGLAIHVLREEAKWWARGLGDMQRPGDERLPAIRSVVSAETAAKSRAKVHTDKK
jgi:predicted metal-dependent hydrolase